MVACKMFDYRVDYVECAYIKSNKLLNGFKHHIIRLHLKFDVRGILM